MGSPDVLLSAQPAVHLQRRENSYLCHVSAANDTYMEFPSGHSLDIWQIKRGEMSLVNHNSNIASPEFRLSLIIGSRPDCPGRTLRTVYKSSKGAPETRARPV